MHKDENEAQDFASPTLDEDIVEITGETHRVEDGRTLHHIRGESGAIYYCETKDLECVRENIRLSGKNERYKPPSRFETVITFVISIALTTIVVAIWNQQYTKAIPVTAAMILILFVYIKFWILRSATK